MNPLLIVFSLRNIYFVDYIISITYFDILHQLKPMSICKVYCIIQMNNTVASLLPINRLEHHSYTTSQQATSSKDDNTISSLLKYFTGK